jgi:hypothetical protein
VFDGRFQMDSNDKIQTESADEPARKRIRPGMSKLIENEQFIEKNVS